MESISLPGAVESILPPQRTLRTTRAVDLSRSIVDGMELTGISVIGGSTRTLDSLSDRQVNFYMERLGKCKTEEDKRSLCLNIATREQRSPGMER